MADFYIRLIRTRDLTQYSNTKIYKLFQVQLWGIGKAERDAELPVL